MLTRRSADHKSKRPQQKTLQKILQDKTGEFWQKLFQVVDVPEGFMRLARSDFFLRLFCSYQPLNLMDSSIKQLQHKLGEYVHAEKSVEIQKRLDD